MTATRSSGWNGGLTETFRNYMPDGMSEYIPYRCLFLVFLVVLLHRQSRYVQQTLVVFGLPSVVLSLGELLRH